MAFRVMAYIDGFNLFYGMRSKGWRNCYWLNLKVLSESLLHPNQTLLRVKYFTAMVTPTTDDPEKHRKQAAYIDALQTLPDLDIIKGHYLAKSAKCHNPDKCEGCAAQWTAFEEKMTDVNIATELLIDTYQDQYDTALLVSADSDLSRPLEAIRQYFPHKRVIAVFPPGRASKQLARLAHAPFHLGHDDGYRMLLDAQFPDNVTTRTGHVVARPASWSII